MKGYSLLEFAMLMVEDFWNKAVPLLLGQPVVFQSDEHHVKVWPFLQIIWCNAQRYQALCDFTMLVRESAWEWGCMNLCLSVDSQLTLHVLECWQSTDITCARVLTVNRRYMCWSVDSQPTVHVLECWQSSLFPILPSSYSEPADGCVQPLLGERWGHHGLISEPPRQVLSFQWKKHTGMLTVYILVYLCITLCTYLLYSCELVTECRGLMCGSPR